MLTEAELNELIAEVERDAVSLAKSQYAQQKAEMKKDEPMDEQPLSQEAEEAPAMDAAPEASEEMPAEEAPAMDAAPAMEEQPMDAPADEAAMEEPMEEQPMDADAAMQEDAPLSVEQLVELYSEMPEEELSMHYEALKQALQKTWMKQSMEKDEYPTDKDANGGEMKAGASMAKSEQVTEKADETQISSKEKELEESVANLIKALETKLPMRKSITESSGTEKIEEPVLAGKDLQEKALELTQKPLTKSERDMLNSFFVTKQGEEQVRELIKSKKA